MKYGIFVALAAMFLSVTGPSFAHGIRPECQMSGAKYGTYSCCMNRGTSRGYSNDYTRKWCIGHGFTGR